MYKHLIQPFMCGLLVCGLKLFGKNCHAQIYHVQSVFSGATSHPGAATSIRQQLRHGQVRPRAALTGEPARPVLVF
jgi:hypothetical protein